MLIRLILNNIYVKRKLNAIIILIIRIIFFNKFKIKR